MEDFTTGFDIDGLLSEEEAAQLFSEDSGDDTALMQETGEEDGSSPGQEAEEPEETREPEKVGNRKVNDKEKEDVQSDDGGSSSPNVFYSSIAGALKDEGVFPDLDDDTIKGIQGPEDFLELFEKAITSRMDERVRRVDEALGAGVAPDTVREYENTLQYLHSIDENALTAEGEEGDNLRRQILYNDFLSRGFSAERAKREVQKSFNSETEVDDARDALDSLIKQYERKYSDIRNDAKKKHDAYVAQQKKSAEDFRKMVIDNEIVLGDQKLDKRTRQKVYDAVSKPVYKDPDTGRLLTQVQKFQKEQPLEFLKQLGLWFVLTNEGKDLVGFTKDKVRSEKHKAIRDLANKINATSVNTDGSLRFASGESTDGGADLLLSDDWKVGF